MNRRLRPKKIQCKKCGVFTSNIRRHNARKRCDKVSERRTLR